MENFLQMEARWLEDLALDYVPLHDISREFAGYHKSTPSNDEFSKTIDFIKFLLDRNKIKIYKGPGVELIQMTQKDFLAFLKQTWNSGDYEKINYGIWFEL